MNDARDINFVELNTGLKGINLVFHWDQSVTLSTGYSDWQSKAMQSHKWSADTEEAQ